MAADIVTGLFAHYKLNETGSTFKDSGPNGLDLTVTADGSFPNDSAVVSGRLSRLFSRANTSGAGNSQTSNYGTRTGINQTLYQTMAGGEMTLACWHRRSPDEGTGTGSDTPITLLGDGSGTSLSKASVALQLRARRTDDKWSIGSGSSSGSLTPTFSTPLIVDNAWVHVAVVLYQSSTGKVKVKLYINGAFVEETVEFNQPYHWTLAPDAGAIGISKGVGTTIGQTGGSLADVRFYSRALTAEDIAGVYAVPAPQLIPISGFNQAVSVGDPRGVPRSNLTTPLVSVIATAGVDSSAPTSATSSNSDAAGSAAKLKSSAPVSAASSNSQVTLA